MKRGQRKTLWSGQRLRIFHIMAKSKNFIGGGFQSDLIKNVKLITRQSVLEFDSNVLSLDKKIIIDGFENYLSILVPPNNSGFFQLFPFIAE